jgi:RimJ/RimL family protein N-acetyltransferase
MKNIFISGEKIDICVPAEEDFKQWASWFNNQKTTQFLEQGKYPNTIENQKKFYFDATNAGRFLGLIKTKNNELLGVISISEIDLDKKCCQISYVCPEKSPQAPLAALEGLALCTQHAFVRFGMSRVWSGHAFPSLKNWIRKTELLGFKAEGLSVEGFCHGLITSDALRTSITKSQFLLIAEKRGGNLWPGEQIIQKMIVEIKKENSLAERVSAAIKNLHAQQDILLERIERDVA